jgi:biopolymer transport protein ExbD
MDLTPMVDVVFLLIIFFMTTAQFVKVTRAEVDLPREKGEQRREAEEAGLVINLMADGRIIVAEQELGPGELEALVSRELARQPESDAASFRLLLRADRNADSTHLNRLVSRLQAQGIGAARIATEVPR